MKKILVVLTPAVVTSCLTLYLIRGGSGIFFFVFEVLLILVMYATLSKVEIVVNFPTWKKLGNLVNNFESIILFGLPAVLLIASFVFRNSLPQAIVLPLEIVVTYFIPGYAFYRIFLRSSKTDLVEAIVLSYAFSVPFSSLAISIILIAANASRDLFFYVFVLAFSLVSVIVTRRNKLKKEFSSYEKHKPLNIILLLLILFSLFYTFIVYSHSLISAEDSFNHYDQAGVVNRTPSAWSSNYPLHIFQMALIYGNINVYGYLTAQLLMTGIIGLVFLFSFYVMSRAIFEGSDKRLPLISTVLVYLFAGLGWVYVLLFQNPSNLSNFNFVLDAVLKTRNDLVAGISLSMYAEFRPEAVSFVIFFALLYLMKRKDLSSKVFFMCFSLLGASLLLVHFPEFAVLLLALSFVSVFVSGNSFRAKDALYSCFLSILIALVVSISWQLLGFSALSPPYLLCMGLATTSAAILGLSSLLKALYINRNLTSWKITSRTRFGIFLILIAVYVLAIISWLDQLNSYDYSSVAESTFIPWFFYPVILGIVPLLAFSCLVFKPTKTSKTLSFMAIFVIVPLVLSLVNNFMTISFVTPPMYANYRLLRVPFVVMTLMASFALVSLHDRISEALRRKRRDFMLVSLLSLIVVGGLSSTFLSTPTSYAWAETYKINEKEYGAVTSLREIIAKNPYASVFTASELSTYVVQLATPLSTFMFGNPIRFQLSSPVTTTIMLNEFAPSKVFVYMHDRDKAYFSSSSYLGHLLEHSEQVVNFSGGTIYELPSLIEPQQNAPTVLATSSEENSSSTYFIYDQLLLSNINFTTMDEEDPGIFQAKNIILLSDPSNSTKDNYLLSKYLRFAQNGGQILVLNSEGFGCFSSLNDLGKQLQEKNCTVVKYQLGKGRIIYLNIYPLMQSESAEENQLINISENILRQMNLPKLTNDDSLKGLLENNVAFKEAQLEGNVSILTDSVIFKSMSGTISIEAEESNYSISQNEVRYLVVEGHDAVKVHTEGLSIVAGEAFYSTMKVTNPSLIYSGKNVSLTMVMNDGSIKNINAGRIVLSLSGDTELLVRNPSIQMKNGIATLKEVYDVYPPAEMSITPFASLFSGKRPLSSVLLEGQNTTIAGDVNLKINLNDDIFTFSYVDYKGILQREPPILMWNEIGSLAKSLKYLPFILVFFLAVWIIRSQYNLRRAHSKGGRQEE